MPKTFDDRFTYSDLSFKPILNNEGDISKVYDYQAIEQSIKNILHTKRGSRPMLPEFGCRLEDYLFEPFDDNTANKMISEIRSALVEYEPRIRIESVRMEMDVDNYMYRANISYQTIFSTVTRTYTVELKKL